MSLFAGVYDIAKDVHFTNVLNSSKDPCVIARDIGIISTGRLNWLDLWRFTTKNTAGDIKCLACQETATVGGHIVLRDSSNSGPNRNAKALHTSNRVFIVPLCYQCNSADFSDKFHSEKIFTAQYFSKVVHLWAFFEDGQRPVTMDDSYDLPEKQFRQRQAALDRQYQQILEQRRRSEAQINSWDWATLSTSSCSASSHPSTPSCASKLYTG